MALTSEEFEAGVAYWRTSGFDADLHNSFYAQMAAINADYTFDQAWWMRFLPKLGAWRATRPYSYAAITEWALPLLGSLQATWEQTVSQCIAGDIASVEWGQVAAFPKLIAEIKPTKSQSPVFASKFCHFLAPRIFPVVDNAALGMAHLDYARYYATVRSEWLATSAVVREALIEQLRTEIGVEPFRGYPFETKAIELCLIGRNHAV